MSISDRLNRSPLAKPAVITFALIAVVVGVWQAMSSFGRSPAALASSKAVFVCSKTGKSFEMELTPGLTNPVLSPYSNEKTGFPAEACYWTKDGKAKEEPTYVLLNSFIGSRDATFCPDCGRLVRPRNPRAVEGSTPPPTREQYTRQGMEE